MNLNFTAPINSTGYGTAGLGYLIFFDYVKKNTDNIQKLTYKNIGTIQTSSSEYGADKVKNIIKEYLVTENHKFEEKTVNLVFWHPSVADNYVIPDCLNILLTTFELDILTPKEVSSMASFDLILFASSFNHEIAKKYPELKHKLIDIIFPHISYPIEIAILMGIMDKAFTPSLMEEIILPFSKENLLEYLGGFPKDSLLYSSIGKFEERKGQRVLLEAFSETAGTPIISEPLILLTFWYNPFIWPNLPFGEIKALGFEEYRTTDNFFIYNKDNKYIVLHKPVPSRRTLYTLASACDYFIDSSRAEGFGLPLYDMLSLGKKDLLCLSTGCEGSKDYIVYLATKKFNFTYILLDFEYETAKDEYFFSQNTEGKWLKLYKKKMDIFGAKFQKHEISSSFIPSVILINQFRVVKHIHEYTLGWKT